MNQKTIAFYLPQFHPIKENNNWWGKGFTEWTNVSQARPRFAGHNQPQIPADLGFYDLRLNEVRNEQAALAKEYGIYGFCYYHYWFNGHMLLERPFNEVLKGSEPNFPFCLCWANENWTRAWDGLDRQILIQQNYNKEDSENHIQWFIETFHDSRYIKIDGRPLLLIYRCDHIPDIEEMILSWRKAVQKAGFPDLYLVAVKNGFIEIEDEDIISTGFNAIVDFQPDRRDFPSPRSAQEWLYRFARRVLPEWLYQRIKLSISMNNVVDYRAMVNAIMQKSWPKDYRKYPCVFPSWDNSPRRKSATIIQNDNPMLYGKWLKHAITDIQSYPDSERLIFINAWNEWAEGCHLEPDQKHGHAFLEQTRDAIRTQPSKE
ncbi:glycosyltransferase WbsX family protein [Thauera phenylacetica]